MSPNWLGILCISLLPFAFGNLDRYYPEKRLLRKKLDSGSGDSNYILPKNCKPTAYELLITPSWDTKTFNGRVRVTMDIVSKTDTIVMNLDPTAIQIKRCQVCFGSQCLNVTQSTTNSTLEMITFVLDSTLAVQQGVNVTIDYLGSLGDDMHGFYLSTYNTTSTNHTMAITQFESTYARQAFPCFDEPAYRAQFLIKIHRTVNQTSMSNMPLRTSTYDNSIGMILDTYEKTPSMPTYLVAFGVSDLASMSDSKAVRVYARPAVIQDASYTVGVAQPILDNLGEFTGITYPLPKMDVVAVPDFDAGAMENWGLTTYREKYVLYNKMFNSWRDKFNVLSVVTHEFGHQWFGDLVTPEWWDYVWLNEAFATYFEYTVPMQVEPTWGMDSTMYVVSAVQYALEQDVGITRPMTSPVYTPKEIEKLFDYVIYEKGGSILRMTENFLTTPVWKAGLNLYLSSNAYGTGTPEKLFTSLESAATAANMNIPRLNETLVGWTTQPGYPVISVTCITNNATTVYNITQAAYNLDSNTAMMWNVPLTYTTQSKLVFNASLAPSHWLLPSDSNTSIVSINDSGWIIFNVDQVGFYRVNYDSRNWKKLTAQLNSNFTVISSINRAQILDDAFHLARTGHLDYGTAFGLTKYLPHETAFAPWNAYFTSMRSLITQFRNTDTGEGLQQYARDVMSIPFHALTANISNSVSTFQGSLIVQSAGLFACEVGLPDCKNMANLVFQQWRKNTSSYIILPEVKQAVFCTGLRLDTSLGAFMDVLDYYLNSNNGAEQLTVLNSLGCVCNAEAINKYMNIVCDANANHVRLQDRWIALRAFFSQSTDITTGLQYLADNFPKVADAVGTRIEDVVSTIASSISRASQINQVKSMINNSTVDQRLRNMLNSIVLPAVTKQQTWLTSDSGLGVKSWVDLYMKSSASPATASVFVLLAVALLTLVNLK